MRSIMILTVLLITQNSYAPQYGIDQGDPQVEALATATLSDWWDGTALPLLHFVPSSETPQQGKWRLVVTSSTQRGIKCSSSSEDHS